MPQSKIPGPEVREGRGPESTKESLKDTKEPVHVSRFFYTIENLAKI